MKKLRAALMIVTLVIAAFALAAPVLAVPSPPVPPGGLTHFTSFALHDGVNRIAHFTQDGRTATIFKAWRDNGNAHGYNIYVVTLPAKASRKLSYDVVGFPGSSSHPVWEFTADDPQMREDWVTSVVFGHGRIDGVNRTIMLRATRLWENSIPTPATTRFEIFVLRENTDGPGNTPEYFGAAGGFSSAGTYCNSDMALFRELKVPLPRSYEGARTRDGC